VREVLPDLLRWWREGATVGMATVVATFRSAPYPPGVSMLVGPTGEAVGSVSGGCVEAAVYDLSQSVVASGRPVLERYGVSDDDAVAVGLTCGGILDVFVEAVGPQSFPELGAVAEDIEAGRPVAVATVVEHPDPERVGRRIVVRPHGTGETHEGGLGSERSDHAIADDIAAGRPVALATVIEHPDPARLGTRVVVRPAGDSGALWSDRATDAVHDDALGLLASGHNATLTYGPDGERRGEGMRVFVWAFAPKPRLLVFGAIDFAAAVARVGSFLGYDVTVCDARPVFATASRFPGAAPVVADLPPLSLRA